jgi:peroxiredoxin
LTADHLSYTLLSDASLGVAAKFGLKYKVKPSVLESLKQAHVDLVQQNGGYLLTPAAFIVDTRGVIRFAYTNTNYTVRVGQPALLAAARAALKKPALGDGL